MNSKKLLVNPQKQDNDFWNDLPEYVKAELDGAENKPQKVNLRRMQR